MTQGGWWRNRIAAAVCASLLALILFANVQSRSAAASGSTVVVTMTDKPTMFVPETVTIRVGDTVEWRNTGKIVHWVTIGPPIPKGAQPFDSGPMPPGAVYRHPFTVAGHYNYVCVPHAGTGMIGVVEVTE